VKGRDPRQYDGGSKGLVGANRRPLKAAKMGQKRFFRIKKKQSSRHAAAFELRRFLCCQESCGDEDVG